MGAGNVSLGGVEFSPAALPCQIIPCTDLLPASLTSITQHSHQQTIENDSGTSNVDKSKQVANTQKHFCIPFNPSRLALTTHCAQCNVQCLTSPDPRGCVFPAPGIHYSAHDPLLPGCSSPIITKYTTIITSRPSIFTHTVADSHPIAIWLS